MFWSLTQLSGWTCWLDQSTLPSSHDHHMVSKSCQRVSAPRMRMIFHAHPSSVLLSQDAGLWRCAGRQEGKSHGRVLQALRPGLRDAVAAAVLADEPRSVREGGPPAARAPVARVLPQPLVHSLPCRLRRTPGKSPGRPLRNRRPLHHCADTKHAAAPLGCAFRDLPLRSVGEGAGMIPSLRRASCLQPCHCLVVAPQDPHTVLGGFPADQRFRNYTADASTLVVTYLLDSHVSSRCDPPPPPLPPTRPTRTSPQGAAADRSCSVLACA